MDSEHRRNPLPFDFLPAPPLGAGRLFKARFAPRSPQTLAAPFRGANSSHNFCAAARGRPAFSKRGLLPAPREPLQLRSGEQILHTISAPPPGAGRLFRGAVCSPFPANPCSSVPGSKFFTQFPRRHLGLAGFFEARFAPRSPRTLVAPFRGANSSHNFRAATRGRPAFSRRGLLPAPYKPLQLRFGEQNLHTIPAPPPEAGRLFRGAVCSPLPTNPCSSVPGSKFFTQFPRRHSGPAGFFEARFAPRSPQTLSAPFRGANSSHNSRASHPKIPEAHSASGIFPFLLSSSTYPFPVAGIPEPGNSPLPSGLPCRKAGIPQSSSG